MPLETMQHVTRLDRYSLDVEQAAPPRPAPPWFLRISGGGLLTTRHVLGGPLGPSLRLRRLLCWRFDRRYPFESSGQEVILASAGFPLGFEKLSQVGNLIL